MSDPTYTPNKQKEKTPMKELDPAYRQSVFEEVALGYSADEAKNEARRCLQCSDAPCMKGCPVGVAIPRFIEQVALGNFNKAYSIVKDANALPAVCGRVCPQETQCEGACRRGRAGEAVGIGRLERFVADYAHYSSQHCSVDQAGLGLNEMPTGHFGSCTTRFVNDIEKCTDSSDCLAVSTDQSRVLSEFSVAVIGSGPAGLTCAGELSKQGCAVTVFEALHKAGGVLTYGIPEFRLPKDLVAKEISSIQRLGVTFERNAVIGRLFDVTELLEKKGFDAVFVATGAGLPVYLNIEGEGLNGVSVANELLTRVNLMKAYTFPDAATPVYCGKTCVVVGGGNVAMDAARTARRLGADVVVVYRRGAQEMPARAEEIHHAQQEGIHFQLLTNPVRIIGNDEGWVSGIECVQMELGKPDASGRRRPKAIEGSEHIIECDMVVVACGSKTNPLIAATTPGLETNPRNLILADETTCATSLPGVFAGGDAVIGAATVILAMGAGKRAAAGIATYLLQQHA